MSKHAELLQHKRGWPGREEALDKGKRRMDTIFLTTETTAEEVLPMILSGISLGSAMGVVIGVGTIVAMLLVVTILPVLYWKLYGNK